MKTGDEMFEKLGYKKYYEIKEAEIDEVEVGYKKILYNGITIIIDFCGDGTVGIKNNSDGIYYFNTQELQAINKKCQELGVDRMKTGDEIKICGICGTEISDGFYKQKETGEIICEECLLESDMVTTETITNYYLDGEYIGNNVDSIEEVIDCLCDTYDYIKI